MLSQKKVKIFLKYFFLLRKTLECCYDEGSLETESIFFLHADLLSEKLVAVPLTLTDSLSSVVNVLCRLI